MDNLKKRRQEFHYKARKTKKLTDFRQNRREIALAKNSPRQQQPMTEFERRKRFWQVMKHMDMNKFVFNFPLNENVWY